MQIDIVGIICSVLGLAQQLVIDALPIALAAIIAMFVYYRQKEYDLIRDRYLLEAIDGAATSLESILSANQNNWARLLHLLKLYKGMGQGFDCEQLRRGFITFNPAELKPIANQRICTLIDDKVIWERFQKALAAFKEIDDFITIEAPLALEYNLHSPAPVKRSLVSDIEKRLIQIDKKLNDITVLVAHIGELARLFEQQKYTFKSIEGFRNLKELKQIVSNLKGSGG